MENNNKENEAQNQLDSSVVNGTEIINNEPTFGMLFDIDGVLIRGQTPLQCAKDMFDKIKNDDGELTIPMAFLTNGSHLTESRIKALQQWFNIKISPDQLIQGPSPFKVFTHWHNKRVLFVGQGNVKQIAKELGFTNVVVLDEIREAYPLLDVMDHTNRQKLAQGYIETKMDPIEAIILTGKPVNWGSYLQILLDLLITNGKPDHQPESFPQTHLPILVSNMDLVYMDQAVSPRLAHGSFLLCLETLYEKITGNPLKYTAILGKPSEITFRFAEHTISTISKRMGIQSPIKSIYFFGDNPAGDILGANLYNNYLKRRSRVKVSNEISKEERQKLRIQASMSSCRVIPEEAEFLPQTVKQINSILVQTGVYKPINDDNGKQDQPSYCHRDFSRAAELDTPMIEVTDCLEGLKQIFKIEKFIVKH